MKHAGPDTLATLAPLLARVRALPGLVERTPGCFYRGSKAFLHFHEDPSGTHADVRLGASGFTRMRAVTATEQAALVEAARGVLEAVRCCATPGAPRSHAAPGRTGA